MINITRFTAIVVILSAMGFNFAWAMQETVNTDGVIKLVASEDDLNQFAKEMTDGPLKGYIKDASVKVFDGYVEVTAIAQKPFVMKLFVKAEINAEDNRLYPKILKMRYGFFPIPNFLVNFLIGKLVGQNSQNFQSAGVETPGIEWRSVEFKTGQATIEFKEVSK